MLLTTPAVTRGKHRHHEDLTVVERGCQTIVFCAVNYVPILIIISLDAEYWQKMTAVIDSSKEHVWDALIDGFEKYLSVLTERAALIQETDALEQQV
jgi:hypothetical protein